VILLRRKEELLDLFSPLLEFLKEKEPQKASKIKWALNNMDRATLRVILDIMKFTIYFTFENPTRALNLTINKLIPVLSKKKVEEHLDKGGR